MQNVRDQNLAEQPFSNKKFCIFTFNSFLVNSTYGTFKLVKLLSFLTPLSSSHSSLHTSSFNRRGMISPLPPELITLIIQFSLPQLKLTTYAERYGILRNYSLVSHLWREIAQDKLIQHIDFNECSQIQSFLSKDSIFRHKTSFQRNFEGIRSICFEKSLDLDICDACNLLDLCRNISELWLIDFKFERDDHTSNGVSELFECEYTFISNSKLLLLTQYTFCSNTESNLASSHQLQYGYRHQF